MTSAESLADLVAANDAARSMLSAERPRFKFVLAFADSYDELLSDRVMAQPQGYREVLERARECGRLLIAAESGSGKTSVAIDVLAVALRQGMAGIRLDLRRRTPVVGEEWIRSRGSERRRSGLLLQALADPPIGERRLRQLAGDAGAVLVVDGLDDLSPDACGELLVELDAFAARCPWASVIVCDRLERRPLPSRHWVLTIVSHVANPAGTHAFRSRSALLLDIVGAHEPSTKNEAKLLLDHVSEAANLKDADELRMLATAAFTLYETNARRTFDREELLEYVGEDLVRGLESGHLLVGAHELSYFRNQLIHDVLAASAIAGDRSRWTPESLNALTLGGNGFDAIRLALELIDDLSARDELLIVAHDWNPYAPVAAVGHAHRRGTVALSSDTELAMLAALAERRWDPVAASVQRVEDALRTFPGQLANDLLHADDLDSVVALILERASRNGAPGRWHEIFAGALGADELIAELRGGSLTGWMAANVLRRRPLDDASRRMLLSALRDPEPMVRWRATYALGGECQEDVAAGLLDVLDHDDTRWARLIAARTLVEIAGRHPELRRGILDALHERLGVLRQQPDVFRELQRALELRDPPIGWASEVAPLVEELFSTADTVEEQDHWRRVGKRISDSVRAARAAQS